MIAHFRETVQLGGNRVDLSDQSASGTYRRFGKRCFDIAFVVATAPISITVIVISAMLAMLCGQKPFYLQARVGKDGKSFNMVKIRTMVADADAVLKDYLAENPDAKAEWDENQKLKHDPRITPFGNILRRTSLDEMPQLWNVFKGDMSIVGPRPMMIEQMPLYTGTAYYDLRPGVTGPWQISDRSEGSFVGRVVYDTEYNRDMSLKTDCVILFKTIGAVVNCTGR
jgi:lipopolysaccharide/colanic/teichoic acid biosynthesis glycosyltransferase